MRALRRPVGSLGLLPQQRDGEVLNGAELAALYLEAVWQAAVCARVYPQQKLRLADAVQSRGEVVAMTMTGDEVNDAPALRRADIGRAECRTSAASGGGTG